MFSQTTRRLLAGLGVAGAFVAASASPAVAADNTRDLWLFANNALISVDGDPKGITLYSFRDGSLTDYTVTIDLSAVSDFATVALTEANPACTTTAKLITCTVKDDPSAEYLADLSVTAKPSAKVGDTGAVTMTVVAPGFATATKKSTVEVGEGVDLRAEQVHPFSAAPGATVKTPLGLVNAGDKAVKGAVMFFWSPFTLTPPTTHRNCQYIVEFYGTVAECRFTEELAAGTAYRLDDSFTLKVAADTWAPSTQYAHADWYTPGDFEEFLSNFDDSAGGVDWTTGTGDPLTLVPATAAKAREFKQTDRHPADNGTDIEATVTGNQRADLAATGDSLSGKVGAEVTTRALGFVNNGPAAIGSFSGGEYVALAEVTVPENVTVRAVDGCRPGDAVKGPTGDLNQPGARKYVCEWPDPVRKAEPVSFQFTFRIDKAAGRAGAVRLFHFDGEWEPRPDLNPKNDTAAIVVKGTGGQGGTGGGDGGTLPITGSSTGLIAGVGALLLVAGAGGYAVARRRRTRFVA